MAVERVDGTDRAAEMPAELIDQRLAAAYQFLAPLLDKDREASRKEKLMNRRHSYMAAARGGARFGGERPHRRGRDRLRRARIC